jgi:hypothetical protein
MKKDGEGSEMEMASMIQMGKEMIEGEKLRWRGGMRIRIRNT